MGGYSIHWNLQGRLGYTQYVRGCSIHDTYNRAIAIQGTHEVILDNNVAMNTMGHTFFLEDGIETGNLVTANLGFLTRPSMALLNTDAQPATFFISNPNNTFRGNVAAGSTFGHGFWLSPFANPSGASATKTICPKFTALGEFSDNRAHSNM